MTIDIRYGIDVHYTIFENKILNLKSNSKQSIQKLSKLHYF